MVSYVMKDIYHELCQNWWKFSKKKESMLKLLGVKLRCVGLKLVLSYDGSSSFFREVVYIRKSLVEHTLMRK